MQTVTRTRVPRWLPWAIAAAGLVLHGWAMWGGFFHMDDFFYLADADRPFWEYVSQIYNGHLMPAEFAIVWSSQSVAPMSWLVAVAVTLTLWAVLLSGVILTTRRLFGDSIWGVISLMLMAFSPLLTTVTVWYASALQILPWAICFVWMLYFASRHATDPRIRWVVAFGLVFAVGLAFWEKVVLALPVVWWIWWRYWPGGGRFGLQGLGRRWWLPATSAGIAAIYSVCYLALQPEAVLRSQPTLADVAMSLRISLGEVWLGGYFGGPWTGFTETLAPGTAQQWWPYLVIIQVVCILVTVSVLRWRPAANAWIAIAGYALVSVLLFAFGRINAFGLALAYDPRYVEDLFVVGAVLLPFAFTRPAGSPLATPRHCTWLPQSVPSWATAGLLLIFANLLALPSLAVGSSWHDSAAKQYVSNARDGLEENAGVAVVDGKVPETVMAALFLDRAQASYVLSGLNTPVRWNGAGPRLLIVDANGTLRDVRIEPSAISVPGLDGECGYKALDAPVDIELDSSLFDWTWIATMDYLAADSGQGYVQLGSAQVPVPLTKGLGSVSFVVVGSGDTLVFTPPPGVGVCVTSVVVGQDGGS